ncbi:hypothetical protein Pmani_027106 [Petrolisthes manimaculis]|uniref:ascorbate ferrireductase (transmembrane) n=1 Tax=Petrolisthes manimaculis TaxID=1843537 RepID=A0AAE1P3W6_9EUCA|nr:hypothetical protein Pmani_027106 [Petrolisthes manimaculis]
MSLLLRVGGFSFIMFIAYAARPGSSLFSFHPLLMTLSFTGLMTEGLFMFSKSGLAGNQLHSTRVTAHWLILLCVAAAHGFGYAAIYYTKEFNNKPHITSWHDLHNYAGQSAKMLHQY